MPDRPVIVVPLSFSRSWHTVVQVGISIAQFTGAKLVF